MSKSISRRIVIACTPRTGSNLLLHSLATHPQAVCGGEWHQWDQTRIRYEWWNNKASAPNQVNLCKVFAPEQVPFEDALVIYLLREDRNAQLASWVKASQTGQWLAGYFSEPTEFPTNATEIIDQAEMLYRPIANLVVSYETMVSNWDETIAKILTVAGWESILLTQQCSRMQA